MEDTKVYSEVYVIINKFDKKLLEKIPKKVINEIDKKRDKEYYFRYDYTRSLNNQKVSSKARGIISALYLKYCCEPEKRRELLKVCLDKNKKLKEEKNQNNILNNSLNAEKVKVIEENNMAENILKEDVRNDNLPIVTKENIFGKIINAIKVFFNRLKGEK